nr:hypothetical protein [Tanacetum cinerariifolium]
LRSGRRAEKEVVVEPDNDDKTIDVNDEPSDDDFVHMGGSSAYASDSRRIERRQGKEVCVEPDNYDNPIDVNDEPSEDDFVGMRGNSAHASGLRRSGRNK